MSNYYRNLYWLQGYHGEKSKIFYTGFNFKEKLNDKNQNIRTCGNSVCIHR